MGCDAKTKVKVKSLDLTCLFTGAPTYFPPGQDRVQLHTAPSHPAAEWGRALSELCRHCGKSGEGLGRSGLGVQHQVLERHVKAGFGRGGRVRSEKGEALLFFALCEIS